MKTKLASCVLTAILVILALSPCVAGEHFMLPADTKPILQVEKTASVPQPRGQHLTVVATAYTPFEPGMTSGTGLAYDGRPAIPFKTLAVDPKVIPLGSRVFIPQYGWFLAHDTGSAIKGPRIDLCLETDREMVHFGVRQMEVYVVPPDTPYKMAW